MNPVLTNIIQGIQQHCPEQDKHDLSKIILAGKKILFDPNFHKNMELVKNPESRQQPVQTIATGVTGLMYLMYVHSNKTLKPTPLILAGCVLMCDVMDFAEKSYGIQINPQMVADTWKLTMHLTMKKLGVSESDIEAAIQKGAGEIQAANQQPQQSGIMGVKQ